jgi:hypothetical protein
MIMQLSNMRKGWVQAALVLVFSMLAAWSDAADPELKRRAIQMLESGPAVFVQNQGQWADGQIQFALSGMGANVGLTSASLRFQLFRREGTAPAGPQRDPLQARLGRENTPTSAPPLRLHQFQATLAGARPVAPAGEQKSAQLFHYRRGERARWRENVPAFEAVRYAGIYPGVDLLVRGRKGGIKYQFELAPGADWKMIGLR